MVFLLGHDSIEDARAAMRLCLLKIANGPGFAESAEDDETESILKVLHTHHRKVG